MTHFRDPITLENTPIERGYKLNGVYFNARSLASMLKHGDYRNPLTRRFITQNEAKAIRNKAGNSSGNTSVPAGAAQLTKGDLQRMKRAGDDVGTLIVNPLAKDASSKKNILVAVPEASMLIGFSVAKWREHVKTNFFEGPEPDVVMNVEHDAQGRTYASIRGVRVPLLHFPATLAACKGAVNATC